MIRYKKVLKASTKGHFTNIISVDGELSFWSFFNVVKAWDSPDMNNGQKRALLSGKSLFSSRRSNKPQMPDIPGRNRDPMRWDFQRPLRRALPRRWKGVSRGSAGLSESPQRLPDGSGSRLRAERSGKEAEFGAAAGPGNLGPAAGGGAGVDAEPGDVRGGPPGWLKKSEGNW